VRVAAVVLVVAVVWRNIPRGNSDTASPTPAPAQQRTNDVVLAAATTSIPTEPVAATPIPDPPRVVATPAPARAAVTPPALAASAAPEPVAEPVTAADTNLVDQTAPPPTEDAGTDATPDSESPQEAR
jgi:hypothetical protein